MDMNKYEYNIIYKVVIWEDENKGWGEALYCLVNSYTIAKLIADDLDPMLGARVMDEAIIIGIK